MSPRTTHARGRWIAAVALALASALPASASAATTIDQGPIDGAVLCSSLAVATTCILPFGDVATASSVVTEIAVGDPDVEVHVARPVPGTPGSWTLSAASAAPSKWKLRPYTWGATSTFDVNIPLAPGEQLVLIDPLVSTQTSVRDFDPTIGENGLPTIEKVAAGEVVGVRPVGRIVTEPDADGDGWGDETQDLCRGVAGQRCAPATVKVALSGPDYVPSQNAASWTWSITNAGPDPQPLVVNLFSAEAAPVVNGPEGAVCSPGQATSSLAAWQVKPSALISTVPSQDVYPYPRFTSPGSAARDGNFFCVLPPLAPGWTASGTVGGTGGHASNNPIRISAVVPAVNAGTSAASVFSAFGQMLHRRAGTVDPEWKATEFLPGILNAAGTFPVSLTCGGPAQAASCTASIVAKAPIGGKVLGKAQPVSVKPGTTAKLKVKFSKAGLLWLATHRKRTVDLVTTTVWPGETPALTTERAKVELSPGAKRKLTALKKAAAKPKKKG